ncbi:MAG TPA: hypothetical protein VFU37_07740 [Pyrinomonadaceae bacterium]|nr:hypothetical protein [Pyrinomonadaceae bacterium]
MRIFSIKRLALSLILGFVLPLSYAFVLSEGFDLLQRPTPQFLVWPFGWPRPLWILLMGRQPSEGDLIAGILFMALGNILVYGFIVYCLLGVFALLRKKPIEIGPAPPPPGHFSKQPAE